jgi:hypothetical protein
MRILLHSAYNHFPNKRHEDNPSEPAIEIYNDGHIWHAYGTEPHGEAALLIEPRPLQESTYNKLETEYDRFSKIFTHDSQLLAIAPNAVLIKYWRDYEVYNEEKTKDFSMICGQKQMCPLHIERMKLAEMIAGEVDVLGDWDGGPKVTRHDAYAPYKFAVVIENYLDDYWFTEKILNAFSTRTVPIYFGARKISKDFDITGIMQVKRLWDIPQLIEDIKCAGVDRVYNNRRAAIERNFQAVQKYQNFEDWFFKNHEGALQEIWNYQS